MGKKPQKEVIRFMMKPSYYQYLGLIVDDKTDIDDETEDGKVHQIIKDNKFTTEIKQTIEKAEGITIVEDSKITVDVPNGTRLVWIDGQGYVLPDQEVKTVAEVKKDLEELKDIEGAGEIYE
jgi:hypothetical protein